MPIEFHCQNCSRLMRTPDSAAGKKGKCPHCGVMMDIPSTSGQRASVSAGHTRGADTGTPREKAQGGDAVGKIEFPCPRCGLPVRTPASTAGKKGKCPNCGEVVQIPVEVAGGAETEDKPTGKIQFRCPGCQKMLRTPADVAGKKIRCPSCRAVLSIPSSGQQKGDAVPVLEESAGLSPLDDAPGLAPLDDAPGLVPLDETPGLAPLDDAPSLAPLDETPGLAPLDETVGLVPVDETPALTPVDGGPSLTPLEEIPSLEPLGDASELSPFEQHPGLSPVQDDPVANAAAYQGYAGSMSPAPGGPGPNPYADDLGAAGATAVNPYQSPALAPAGYAAQQAKPFNEAIVVAPAIAMMVVVGLNFLVTIPYLIYNMLNTINMGRAVHGEDEAFLAGYIFGSVAVSVVLAVVLVAIYVIAFIGAWKMMKMQSYGLAMTAAILMLMPCTFCWIGLPFGIWALVVLCLQDIRQAFT